MYAQREGAKVDPVSCAGRARGFATGTGAATYSRVQGDLRSSGGDRRDDITRRKGVRTTTHSLYWSGTHAPAAHFDCSGDKRSPLSSLVAWRQTGCHTSLSFRGFGASPHLSPLYSSIGRRYQH